MLNFSKRIIRFLAVNYDWSIFAANLLDMRNWIIFGVIVAGLVIALIFSFEHSKNLSKKYENAIANQKAYDMELSSLKEKNTAYKFTVEQLEYYSDSVLKALNVTRKELKIKDKQLQSMYYIESGFSHTDTIVLKDTLFKEPSLAIDTVLKDDWYKVMVGLKYPSIIAVKPEFRSEKHVIISSKRETVNPPKKIFFLRWFQKKHTVLHIDVVEKNPYVTGNSSKYVEIIR